MKFKFYLAALAVWACALAPAAASADGPGEVRSAIEQAFRQLRSGDYAALYEALPTAARRRVTRERFVTALERSRGLYQLERMEVGEVHVSGDLAVAETIVYGRLQRPIEGEGKIASQQYLVRESGRWRVATGDRATAASLLSAQPAFARRFPARPPRIFIKRDGRWVDISSLSPSRPR